MYLIAGKQLSLEPRGMGDGVSSLPFIMRYMKRKNKYFTLARCSCVFLCMHPEICIPIMIV